MKNLLKSLLAILLVCAMLIPSVIVMADEEKMPVDFTDVDADDWFVYYVDYLVENFLPKSNSRSWVDKVRKLGNDSAHKYVIAEQEIAKMSIKFLVAILKNIYEYPNSIEEE